MERKENLRIERQLLSVIWKSRVFILIMAIICGVVAFAATYLITPLYEIHTIIEPSKVRIFISEETQEEILLENPVSLASKIREGAYDQQIKTMLQLPLITQLKWRAVESKGTDKIMITLLWPDQEGGNKILGQLIIQIENDLELKVRKITQKYIAGMNSYKQKNSGIVLLQQKIAINLADLQNELKTLSDLRLDYKKELTDNRNDSITKDNAVSFLMSTLSSRDMLESRTNIVTEIAGLEKTYTSYELVKAENQKFYDIIASENDTLKPLRMSGGIESSPKPVTIGKWVIIISGSVIGLLLALIRIVINKNLFEKFL